MCENIHYNIILMRREVGMKKTTMYRWLSIMMAAIIAFSSVEMPVVAEEAVTVAETSDEQSSEVTDEATVEVETTETSEEHSTEVNEESMTDVETTEMAEEQSTKTTEESTSQVAEGEIVENKQTDSVEEEGATETTDSEETSEDILNVQELDISDASDDRYLNIRLIRGNENYLNQDLCLSSSFSEITDRIEPTSTNEYGVYSFSINEMIEAGYTNPYVFLNGNLMNTGHYNKNVMALPLYCYYEKDTETNTYYNDTVSMTVSMDESSNYVNCYADKYDNISGRPGINSVLISCVFYPFKIEDGVINDNTNGKAIDNDNNYNVVMFVTPIEIKDEDGNHVETIDARISKIGRKIDLDKVLDWEYKKYINGNEPIWDTTTGIYKEEYEPKYIGLRDSLNDVDGNNYTPAHFNGIMYLKDDPYSFPCIMSKGMTLYLYRDYKTVILRGNGATSGGTDGEGNINLYYGMMHHKGARREAFSYVDPNGWDDTYRCKPEYNPANNHVHPELGQGDIDALYPLYYDHSHFFFHPTLETSPISKGNFEVNIPVREGYTFEGYSTSNGTYEEEIANKVFGYIEYKGLYYINNDSNPLYSMEDESYSGKTHGLANMSATMKLENETTRLYAIWKNADGVPDDDVKYSLTYDGNGATLGNVTPVKQFEEETDVVVADNTGNLVHPYGYKFLGWSTNKYDKAPEYIHGSAAQGTIHIDDNIVLYAIWGDEAEELKLNTWTESKNYAFKFELDAETELTLRAELDSSLIGYSMVIESYDDRSKQTKKIENVVSDVIFRRITLPKGIYYVYLCDDWHKYPSITTEYPIYITTYREGFDLTRDAFPVINIDSLFPMDVKYVSSDNTLAGLRAEYYYDFSTYDKTYKSYYDYKNLLDMQSVGHCLGMSLISALKYKEMLTIDYDYFGPENSLNANGFDEFESVTVTENGKEKEYQLPKFTRSYDLGELINQYCIFQYSIQMCEWETEQNLMEPSFENIIKQLQTNTTPLVISIKWKEAGHILLVDTTRKVLDLGDGRYRVYVYDCNSPYYEALSIEENKDHNEPLLLNYAIAEDRYIDLNVKDETWEFMGAYDDKKNREIYGNNVDGTINSVESEIHFLNCDRKIVDDISNKLNYLTKFGEMRTVISVTCEQLSIVLKSTSENSKEDEKDIEVSETIVDEVNTIGSTVYNGSSKNFQRFNLPNDNYSVTFEDGYVDYTVNGDLVSIESTGKVTFTIVDSTTVKIKADEPTTIQVGISEIYGDKYTLLDTEMMASNDEMTISLNDTYVNVENAPSQNIDIEIKTDEGFASMKGISTDNILNMDISDEITKLCDVTFDECGGTEVTDIKDIVENTCVEMPTTTKDGLVFGGWYTEKEGSGIQYTNNTPVTGDVTLYAYWYYPGMKILGIDESGYTYTGAKIKPDVSVYDEGVLLEKDKDYTITYKNNQKANDASVTKTAPTITVTGTGNYKGSGTATFVINPKSINDEDVSVSDIATVIYNGKNTKPIPTVTWGDIKLVSGTDYTVAYYSDVETRNIVTPKAAGTYYVMVSGKGNYQGSVIKTFVIADSSHKLTSMLTVAKIKNQKYTGKPIVLTEDALVVKDGKTTLTAGKDYFVSYSENHTDIGTVTVTITGNQTTYIGSKQVTFKIVGTALSTAKIKGFTKTKAYENGNAVMQDVTFSITSGKPAVTTILKGIDAADYANMAEGTKKRSYNYIYEYQNNTYPGTATVIYTGVNDFSGTITKTFTISGISMKNVKVKGLVNAYTYDGTTKTQDALVLTYTSSKGTAIELKGILKSEYEALANSAKLSYDYTYEYTNNIDAGEATITLTGVNAYKGSVKKIYTINKFDIAKDTNDVFKVILKESTFHYSAPGVKPIPKVTFNGTVLSNGIDYTLSYTNNKAVNDGSNNKKIPTVVITGKGNFKGIDQTCTFKIVKGNFSTDGIKVSAADKVYTNKKGAWKSAVTVTDTNGTVLKLGTDYVAEYQYVDGTIIRANDIVPAGTTIKVIVTGKGKYEGTASTEYRVVSKKIDSLTITVKKKSYTGNPVKLTAEDFTFKSGNKVLTDVTFEIDETTYTNNVNSGNATVVIKGTGSYGGTKKITFTIGAKGF